MLNALLEGKLSSEQENMEDVLTSSVFGVFQYSAASAALIRFLRKSEPVYGDIPIPDDTDACQVRFDDYDFWPFWSGLEGVDNCEPDLVIRIRIPAGQDLLVGIEAKFHSGKSASPTEDGDISDQLAKQWVHLHKKAHEKSQVPWLIYLTADTAKPATDFLEAEGEISRKLAPSEAAHQLRISWLSWRELVDLFEGSDKKQLSDLSSLAARLGLKFFKGMGRLDPLPECHYQFCPDKKRFKWDIKRGLNSNWRFNDDK